MRVQRFNVNNAQQPPDRPANVNRIAEKQKREKTKSMRCCGRQRLDACTHKRVNVHPRCRHLSNPLPRAGHPARVARILAAGRRRGAAAAPTRRAGTCARGAARWHARRAADSDARSRWWRQRYHRWWAPPFWHPAAAVAADTLALHERRRRSQQGGRRGRGRHGRAEAQRRPHRHWQSVGDGRRQRRTPRGQPAAAEQPCRRGRRRLGRRRPHRRRQRQRRRWYGTRRAKHRYRRCQRGGPSAAAGGRRTLRRRGRCGRPTGEFLGKKGAPQRRVVETPALSEQVGRLRKHVCFGIGAHPSRPPPQLPHDLGVRRVSGGEARGEGHGPHKQLKPSPRAAVRRHVGTGGAADEAVLPRRRRRKQSRLVASDLHRPPRQARERHGQRGLTGGHQHTSRGELRARLVQLTQGGGDARGARTRRPQASDHKVVERPRRRARPVGGRQRVGGGDVHLLNGRRQKAAPAGAGPARAKSGTATRGRHSARGRDHHGRRRDGGRRDDRNRGSALRRRRRQRERRRPTKKHDDGTEDEARRHATAHRRAANAEDGAVPTRTTPVARQRGRTNPVRAPTKAWG
ncbi:hypothetical protein BU14_0106s0030 [Porphyra umbilicalis]|uniref:Uncharacterized protein n=1 Tax=Porphyra umbilicalis TaxID=2786 RepID=A0A1X6PCJ9_PORUM|nr:hypothetical protein BU14_0106s0030 [Porphyra umbilicalis]|eukprot:OSX78564.1 hypothetical protein BU14_0106s0030 [Porphyra umbilicalis]